MWRPGRSATDGTAVLFVRWAYRPVSRDVERQPSDRSACDVWEAKALFPSHGFPYASPREKAHGLSMSSAAHGPETVRCDRLLVRAVVPCSGSFFLRGPVSVRRVSRFSLKSLRWRHIVERLIGVSLRTRSSHRVTFSKWQSPVHREPAGASQTAIPVAGGRKGLSLPGGNGARRTWRRWWRRLSYTVQVSSWESPTVALTGLGLVRTAITPVVCSRTTARASLALGSTFSRLPPESPRWLKLDRARVRVKI